MATIHKRRAPRRPVAVRARNRGIAIAGAVSMVGAVIALVISAGGARSPGKQPANDAVGASSGEVALEMLDGSTASLADYRGKPLVVNFFAS